MKKVLVTGANGFLGYYLVRQLLEKGFQVMATGKGECRLPWKEKTGFSYRVLDFTSSAEVKDALQSFQPDVIIHNGAITKADDCEQDKPKAWQTNVEGTRVLLETAQELSPFFIFISTDFVFDGIKGMYAEEDATGPVNYYGETKVAAEALVKAWPGDWSIIRTVLVYGRPHDSRDNILSFVKNKLEKQEKLSIYDDQLRTPTWVEDLAAGITAVTEKHATGIFHISGADKLTPYAMACALADHLSLDKTLIRKVNAEEFSQPAKRPPVTGFDLSKAKRELGYEPVSFAEGLRRSF